MKLDIKASLFQPRWRRMKEKPPSKKLVQPAKLSPRPSAQKASWPEVHSPHRVDGWAREAE